jgi:hypothetical protein
MTYLLIFLPLFAAWVGLCYLVRKGNRVKHQRMIQVQISVDTTQFARAIAKATKSAQEFQKSMLEVQRAMQAATPSIKLMAEKIKEAGK